MWDVIQEQRRKELQRIASYTQRHLEEYDRYSRALALIPPDTVLQRLYDFTFEAIREIEGPVAFVNNWAFLSHLLTRKSIAIEMIPEMPVFTWDWEMVIGLSSMCKSLPVRVLTSWLKDRVKTYPPDLTDAVLKTQLALDPKGMWTIDECGELLKEIKNPNSGKRGLLLELADAPSISIARRGSKKGLMEYEEIHITHPALTIIANTTISDFVHHIDINEFFSGFLQRWNFCLVDRFMRNDRDGKIHIDDDKKQEILSTLEEWYDSIPENRRYQIGKRANDIFQKWYEENLSFKAVIKEVEQGRESILSFKQRQKLNIIRCAMVYQSLLDPSSDVIGSIAMEYSIRLAQWRLSNLYALLQNYVFFNEVDKYIKAIRRMLTDAGERGMSRTDMLANIRGIRRMTELDEILESMMEEGIIYKEGKRFFLKKNGSRVVESENDTSSE
jgi:hypothetical protein